MRQVEIPTSMNRVEARLNKMQDFYVGGTCTIKYNGGPCHAQITGKWSGKLDVRVLDHSLPLGTWPTLTLNASDVQRAQYSKCANLDELVDSLKVMGALRTPKIEKAFRKIDRAWFCHETPYWDAAIDIGCEMCISSPHMHIWYLELVRDLLKPATAILDVGTGSGYLAAIFAELSPYATIYGIDCFQDLIEKAKQRMQLRNLNQDSRIHFLQSKGEEGYKGGGPYDIITVGYMCEGVPTALIDQLKVGGRLILPTTPQYKTSSYDSRLSSGEFTVLEKMEDGVINSHLVMRCSFLPSYPC